MEKTTREKLAKVAKDMAQVPFHGEVDGMQHGHSKKQMVYGVQLSSSTAARKLDS